jgi:heat shock protein HslJ
MSATHTYPAINVGAKLGCWLTDRFGVSALLRGFVNMTGKVISLPRRRGVGWATALLLALGCARAGDSPHPAEPPALEGTEWTLVSIDGRPPVAGSRISLEFGDATLGGYSGCNWYGGTYGSSAAGLEIGEVQSTARACAAPGLTEQEGRYQAALAAVRGHRTRDGRLELTDASGRATLVFAPREHLAMDPEALVGTRWRLARILGASGAEETADTTMTLRFGRGTASGFAGCRDYTATYEARGDRIHFTSFAMASTECDRGEAELLREGDFTTDLGESTYYRLTAGRLEMVTHGGRTLTFVAEPGG